MKPFRREAVEFLEMFEGRLTEAGKLKQVRAMLHARPSDEACSAANKKNSVRRVGGI